MEYRWIPEEGGSSGKYGGLFFFLEGDCVGGWTGRPLQAVVIIVSLEGDPLVGNGVEAEEGGTRIRVTCLIRSFQSKERGIQGWITHRSENHLVSVSRNHSP